MSEVDNATIATRTDIKPCTQMREIKENYPLFHPHIALLQTKWKQKKMNEMKEHKICYRLNIV
jgi:hypothetical protein